MHLNYLSKILKIGVYFLSVIINLCNSELNIIIRTMPNKKSKKLSKKKA